MPSVLPNSFALLLLFFKENFSFNQPAIFCGPFLCVPVQCSCNDRCSKPFLPVNEDVLLFSVSEGGSGGQERLAEHRCLCVLGMGSWHPFAAFWGKKGLGRGPLFCMFWFLLFQRQRCGLGAHCPQCHCGWRLLTPPRTCFSLWAWVSHEINFLQGAPWAWAFCKEMGTINGLIWWKVMLLMIY